MELIDLVPMESATKRTVAVCLEDAVAKTGAPRAILSDHAADLHGAIAIFRQQHPETSELYDIKHKAACLLKALLEGDEHWTRFASLAAQAKCAIQQTLLACLVPPSQRSKSRFMNLGELVRWGRQTLALLDDPCRLERLPESSELVREKLGWLAEYRESLGMVGLPRPDRGSLGFRSMPWSLHGSGAGLGRGVARRLGGSRGGVARALDRLRDGRVIAGSNGRGSARDDGGTGVVFRETEGSGRWPIQEWVHRVGAEPGGDGLDRDSGGHRRGLGAMPSSRRPGLVPREAGGIGPIAEEAAYTEPKCEQIRDERDDGARPTFHHASVSVR